MYDIIFVLGCILLLGPISATAIPLFNELSQEDISPVTIVVIIIGLIITFVYHFSGHEITDHWEEIASCKKWISIIMLLLYFIINILAVVVKKDKGNYNSDTVFVPLCTSLSISILLITLFLGLSIYTYQWFIWFIFPMPIVSILLIAVRA